jgi:hypothetical protein
MSTQRGPVMNRACLPKLSARFFPLLFQKDPTCAHQLRTSLARANERSFYRYLYPVKICTMATATPLTFTNKPDVSARTKKNKP